MKGKSDKRIKSSHCLFSIDSCKAVDVIKRRCYWFSSQIDFLVEQSVWFKSFAEHNNVVANEKYKNWWFWGNWFTNKFYKLNCLIVFWLFKYWMNKSNFSQYVDNLFNSVKITTNYYYYYYYWGSKQSVIQNNFDGYK